MSKTIFDFPQLLEELPLLTLTQAAKEFPVPCCRSTLERWIRRGSRGTLLETVLVGGKRYTTKEAILRFLNNQQHVAPEQARSETKGGRLSKKEIEEASRRFGLPMPK